MATNSVYNAASHEVELLFADYMEGGSERPAFVLSSAPLASVARTALEKSFAALGFLGDACAFATLLPSSAYGESEPQNGKGIALDAQALFMLIEGLDPLFVIATDEEAVRKLEQAYQTDFRLDSPARVFGRRGIAFKSIDELLQTEAGKRKTWELLKTLVA